MNLFSRVWSRFNSGGLANRETGAQQDGPTSVQTHSGITLGDEGVLGLSSVWACVQIITNAIASLPVEWYRKVDGNRELLDIDDPLSRLFLLQPNQFMKTRDFRKALTFQMAFWNNGYAKIDWSKSGRPIALTPLDPPRMMPYRDETGLSYHYSTDHGTHVFAPKSILHLKGITSNGLTALNRVSYARQTLGITASADRYASKQFANGGKPAGVLKVDEFLTPEQRAKLREIYEGVSATADGANKIWVLEGGTDYVNNNLDPDKMQMIGTREHQLGEAARFWGVPDVLIGAGSKGSAWPASFEQQVLAFLTFTLQSYMDEWEAALQHSLVPLKDKRRIFFDHDVDGFIRMDSDAKQSYLSGLVQNGLLTRNEGRMKLNKPSVEGGDDLTVQLNLTKLALLGDKKKKDTDSMTINEKRAELGVPAIEGGDAIYMPSSMIPQIEIEQ